MSDEGAFRRFAPPGSPRPQVTRRRRWARVVGTLMGLGVVAGVVIVGMIVGDKLSVRGNHHSLLLLVAVAGLLTTSVGFYLRGLARVKDDDNYILQKAPHLPLRLVHEHDDVWLEGRVQCPSPQSAPVFGVPCAWYRFVEKERRGHGKNQRWVTIRDETRHTETWLADDDGQSIQLEIATARLEDLPAESTSAFNRKYHLRYLPAMGAVSACGVVQYRETSSPRILEQREAGVVEQAFAGLRGMFRLFRVTRQEPVRLPDSSRRADEEKQAPGRERWLTPYRHVPLLITPLPRPEWHDRAEAGEVRNEVAGAVALVAGLSGCVWAFSVLLELHTVSRNLPYVVAPILGVLLFLPLTLIGRYNRFVRYRQRVLNARSHVDVDLQLRNDLIPNLVEICKAVAAHERDLFQKIAEIRTQEVDAVSRIATDPEVRSLTKQMLAVVEDYPDLVADTAFVKLRVELTAIEEKLAHGRSFYNETVAEYDTTVESFPNNLIAGYFGFGRIAYWKETRSV